MPRPDETTVTPTDGATAFVYQDRLIQAREIGVSDASRLAALVGGVRGLALFVAARGDSNRAACEQLGMDREELDDLIVAGDGHRLAGS
ncbi:MAG: hypothetical protein M3451_08295 [Chloroflexota bacterium]|nr:hypothetical protein [Acidobacteriota bacterium]MDQ3525035.1 hypothetical protein [Chloroflexota bacterium]